MSSVWPDAAGRFIRYATRPSGQLGEADPGNLQSFNRYSYVLNNPLKYIDPTGHFNVPGFLVGLGLAVIGAVLCVTGYGSPVGAILLGSGVATMGVAAAAPGDGVRGITFGGGGDTSGWSTTGGSTGSTSIIPGGGYSSSGGGGGGGGGGGVPYGGTVSATYGGTTTVGSGSPGMSWGQPGGTGGIVYMDQMSSWAGAQLEMDPSGRKLLDYLNSSPNIYTVSSEYRNISPLVPSTALGITGNAPGESGYESANGLDIRLFPSRVFELEASNVANLGHELGHAAMYDYYRTGRRAGFPEFLVPFLSHVVPGQPQGLQGGAHMFYTGEVNGWWGDL